MYALSVAPPPGRRPERAAMPPPINMPPTIEREAAVRGALAEGHARIRRFLIGRLGSEDEAAEVLQDFSVRALAHAGDLRDIASLRGWLSRLLASAVADHRRRMGRRRRRESPLDPEGPEPAAPPPDPALDLLVCECLHLLLPTLPPAQADLIHRIDIAEEPRDRVAADLGVTPGALAVRLHRARRALRDRLLQKCMTCPWHGFLDCGCDVVGLALPPRGAARAAAAPPA